MNKTKWLYAILLASWTLNVALLVAYFLKTTYPPGARLLNVPSVMLQQGQFPDIPPMMRTGFREEVEPLELVRSRLSIELSEAFAADELDTMRLLSISDSLHAVRGQLQRKLLTFMGRLHGELTPEERYHLSRCVLPRMMGKGGGRPGPGCRPGRGWR